MKKLVWFLIVMFPLISKAQPGWTPQQQEEFRKQMEDFKVQMELQMQSLQDSLSQMQEALRSEQWYLFDSMDFEMPEMPEMPSLPEELYSPGYKYDYGYDYDYEGDSTEVRVGKWKLVVHDDGSNDQVEFYKDEEYCEEDYDTEDEELDNIETKFFLLDVGLNNYFAKGFKSVPSQYSQFDPNPGRSWVVNIHAVNQRLNLIRHHLWLSYGIYFELNSYKYNGDNVLVPGIDSIAFETSGDAPLKKNKLASEYVGIPIVLRFETNPYDLDNSFHISAGGFGEYLLGAHTKTKTESGDKVKRHDDFNLNTFRYGATARIGYGWVSVFSNIAVSELLKENTGPVLYPFSAGLAFEF